MISCLLPGYYSEHILPGLSDRCCRKKPTMLQRRLVIPYAEGDVLEVGIGSGLNLPLYDPEKVHHVTAIDPSEPHWNKRAIDTKKLPFGFKFINASAQEIPFDSNAFDTVVITYALCSISDPARALSEMRRVLKPQGRFVFCEHGRAPDRAIRRLQSTLNPFWKIISGGCNLNRDIPGLISGNGFRINAIETGYVHGWKPGSFNYWGQASPV